MDIQITPALRLALALLPTVLITFTALLPAHAQESSVAGMADGEIAMVRAPHGINVDGVLDEDAWSAAGMADDFVNKWPRDSGPATARSEVRMLFDDEHLYLGITLHEPHNNHIVQSLKRDPDDFWESDAIGVVIDPVNRQTNGFFFGVNAGGGRMEGLVNLRNNQTRLDVNWDNRWYSSVSQGDGVWYVEIAIPFKTLRFDGSNRRWAVNFVRRDMKRNEFSTWTRVPLGFPGIDLGHMGALVWDEPPGTRGGNVALVPYAAGGVLGDFGEGGAGTGGEFDVGGDAKVALNSSLNLDLTVNPDFSNVDVDRQVTNLTRFSIFFPEKRPFFLENSDIFSNFGMWEINPFFSRRIGLQGGEEVPILFGTKLSGNLTPGLRMGAMNVQTLGKGAADPQNYTVAAVQQRLTGRSQLRGFFVNKQSTSGEADYNRLGGGELSFISPDGTLGATAMYHAAFTEEGLGENDFFGLNMNYNGRSLQGGLNAARVNRNYITEVGFTPRLFNHDAAHDTTRREGFDRLNTWLGYQFTPGEGSAFNNHGPGAWSIWYYDGQGGFTERTSGLWYNLNFSSGHFVHAYTDFHEVQLPYATRLLGGGYEPLPADRYRYYRSGVRFNSDTRRDLSAELGLVFGTFYNGSRYTLSAALNLRSSPWGNFGMSYTLNRVRFPGPYGEATLHLVGPRAEISFSNSMFWTTFLQYNTQARNFNINSRFQWRFLPMSDLFVVFNDNYGTEGLRPRSRGVVFKVNYWFGL